MRKFVNGDIEVPSEKGGDSNRIVGSESREAKDLEEMTIENLVAEKEQPIPVNENSNKL